MAVKLRLRRMGKKKQPFYRIVAMDSRVARDGKYIEKIGHYNPLVDPPEIMVYEEKALFWLNRGAIPTDTVKNLLSKNGIMLKWHLMRNNIPQDKIEEEMKKWEVLQIEKRKKKEALKAQKERERKEEEKEENEIIPEETKESKVAEIVSEETKESTEVAEMASEETKESTEVAEMASAEIKESKEVAEIASEETKESTEVAEMASEETKESKEVAEIASEEAKESKEVTEIASEETIEEVEQLPSTEINTETQETKTDENS